MSMKAALDVSVRVTAVAAEAVEVSMAGSVRVTAVAAKAVEDSAEVTVSGTVVSSARVTEVVAEVKNLFNHFFCFNETSEI